MTLPKSDELKGITHFTIVKILKKFSPKEMNEFEKMLNSPFFNNHSTIVKLFGELKKYYPEFCDKHITKKYLFNIVNKGQKYDDKLFRKYLSRLNKLTEEYLNILQMRLESDRKELNILHQLSKRDLKEVFEKKLKEVEKTFEKENKLDADNFLLKHQLSTIKYNHKLTQNVINSHLEDLVDSNNYLINYHLFHSVSIFNQMDTDKYSFNISEKDKPVPALFDKINIEEYVNAVKRLGTVSDIDRILFLELILYDMKLSFTDSDKFAYNNLKSLVYENSRKLSSQMLHYYLQRLNVFCILENAKGNQDMNKELFENYKKLLDNNLFNLDETSSLTLLDFRLILSSALKNNEFNWSERFINDNLNLIKEEFRNNIFHFGNALLSFYKNKYSDSLDHISKINHESIPITTDIYILKAKIFYMLGHFDSALAVANSFRHFITGNKLIADFHKDTLLNFLKYFKIILRLTVKSDKSKLKNLLTELQNVRDTKEKKWMIEITSGLMLR